MKNLIIVLFIFVGIGAGLFAQETEPTNEELLEKIEILEAEIEKVKIEAEDNSPLATGAILESSRGISFGLKMTSTTDAELDLMYNFPIGTFGKKDFYNSNNQGRTMGIGLLLGFRSKDEIFLDSRNENNDDIYVKLGLKTDFSTPIMLNYLNLSSSISPFIILELHEENYATSIDFGVDMSININIWLNNNVCAFTGMMIDPSFVTVHGGRDLINPLSYKQTFGIKYFF